MARASSWGLNTDVDIILAVAVVAVAVAVVADFHVNRRHVNHVNRHEKHRAKHENLCEKQAIVDERRRRNHKKDVKPPNVNPLVEAKVDVDVVKILRPLL